MRLAFESIGGPVAMTNANFLQAIYLLTYSAFI